MPITAPSTPDWPALRKRLEYVTANPAEWRQNTWGARITDTSPMAVAGVTSAAVRAGTHCGTVACLAGGILLDADAAEFDRRGALHPTADALTGLLGDAYATVDETPELTGVVAARLLGLDPWIAQDMWRAQNTLRRLWTTAAAISGGEIEVPAELPAWADVPPGPYDPSDADAVAAYRADLDPAIADGSSF